MVSADHRRGFDPRVDAPGNHAGDDHQNQKNNAAQCSRRRRRTGAGRSTLRNRFAFGLLHYLHSVFRFRCNMLNTTGTKNNVATVAKSALQSRRVQAEHFVRRLRPDQRHRHHADDHGESRHQHGTKTGEAGFEGGSAREPPAAKCSLAKLTTRILLAVATPTLMMAPINAGTLMWCA